MFLSYYTYRLLLVKLYFDIRGGIFGLTDIILRGRCTSEDVCPIFWNHTKAVDGSPSGHNFNDNREPGVRLPEIE
jgi:hypothetical protein